MNLEEAERRIVEALIDDIETGPLSDTSFLRGEYNPEEGHIELFVSFDEGDWPAASFDVRQLAYHMVDHDERKDK